MTDTAVQDLASIYLRLRPNASVETLPGGESFWQQLAAGELGSFHNEFLAIIHQFDTDWPISEMHPNGDEVVCLLSGAVTFVLELSGGTKVMQLNSSGEFVVVPQGTWHTAKTKVPTRMLFITAGEGTQHRALSI